MPDMQEPAAAAVTVLPVQVDTVIIKTTRHRTEELINPEMALLITTAAVEAVVEATAITICQG